MDIYKYQIWTCNIPGVYTPGCNDEFVLSSTTPSTAVELQIANINMATLTPRIGSSQYRNRAYNTPTSSQSPTTNPCVGKCSTLTTPCYPELHATFTGLNDGFIVKGGNTGLEITNIDPIILNTLPTLPTWDELDNSNKPIYAIFNLYGPSYTSLVGENIFTNYLDDIDWDGPGAYEFFACGKITTSCSENEPIYTSDVVQYPVQVPAPNGGICTDNSGVNSGVLFTTIHVRSCDPIEGNSHLKLDIGFDSNWGNTIPQIGQTLVVNLKNSTILSVMYDGDSVIPEIACANLCFTIIDIYVSSEVPSSTVDILQYPYDCNGEFCNTDCKGSAPQDIDVVDLTNCGDYLGEIWGNKDLWVSSVGINKISLNDNPELLTASINGDSILVNLNSIVKVPGSEAIFWGCYTVGAVYSTPAYMVNAIVGKIDIVDTNYECDGVLSNTYPGTGCADPKATNYDKLAVACYAGYTPIGGTPTDCCTYGAPTYGCTNPAFTNYNPFVTSACNGYNGNPVGNYSSTGGVPCSSNIGVINCCCNANTISCPLLERYGFLGSIWMGVWDAMTQAAGLYNGGTVGWASVVEWPASSSQYWFKSTGSAVSGTDPPGAGTNKWLRCQYNCIDPLADNFNPLASVDCSGDIGGTDYSCCVYTSPCSNQLTIFLEQDFNDIGHYSLWDGEILQKDTFSNFTWSASTGSPWTVMVQNSTEFGFYEDTQGFTWVIDWGDGTSPQTVQYPTTELTYVYADEGTYTVGIQMSAPWGITSVSQPLTLPASNANDPNFDPNPNATFMFDPPGGWPTLPMNWLYSDWGPLDSGVDPQAYVTANYTALPFCFTGVTESQLGAFQTYSKGSNDPNLESGYFLNVSTPLGGQVEMPDGTIQNDLVGEIIAVNLGYTAYTISDGSQGAIGYPVTLYDFDNGITIFESCSDGLRQYNMYTIDCGDEEITCESCLGDQPYGPNMNLIVYVNNDMGVWDAITVYSGGDFVFYNGCCWYATNDTFSGQQTEPTTYTPGPTYWFLCPGMSPLPGSAGGCTSNKLKSNTPYSDCFNQEVTNPLTGTLMHSNNNYTGNYDHTTNYNQGDIISDEICGYIAAISGVGSSLGSPSALTNPNWVLCPTNPSGCLGSNTKAKVGTTGWSSTDNLVLDDYCVGLQNDWESQGSQSYQGYTQIYNVGDVIDYKVTTGPATGTVNFFTPSPNPASIGFSGIINIPPEPQNVGCYGDGCNPTNLSTDYWRGCAFTVI